MRNYGSTVRKQREKIMSDHTRLFPLAVIIGVASLAATAAPQLKADEFDHRMIMTFIAPVEVAGTTVPAGTYVFKALQEDMNIVVVMNRDESHLVALFRATPIESPVMPDEPRIELSKGVGNTHNVVRALFYPGDSIGWKFPVRKGSK